MSLGWVRVVALMARVRVGALRARVRLLALLSDKFGLAEILPGGDKEMLAEQFRKNA